MGFVDQDRVVLAQERIGLRLGEQDTVGHQLDVTRRRDLVGEADLEADMAPELRLQLLRDARGSENSFFQSGLGLLTMLST